MALSRFATRVPFLENAENTYMQPRRHVDEITDELRRLTSKIHAGFLFEKEERNTLRDLCRSVGKTDVDKPYSNWKDFGYFLGLEQEDINHIDLYFKYEQGPVWLVLSTYVQRDDATLEKVIHALQLTDRKDTIFIISDAVYDLLSRVSKYLSFLDTESGILRPVTLPPVPFTLELPDPTIPTLDKVISNTPTVPEQNVSGIIGNTKKSVPSACIVMLTFANDGAQAAKRIAEILRSHKPKIGVLILKEQQIHYFVKTQEFVNDCIKQVDTIIPILTKGYIDTINGRRTSKELLSSFAIDQQYAQYIYKCFSSEFITGGCEHKRVRCILPNDKGCSISELNLELNIWFKEAEIKELINLLLCEKRSR